MSSSNNVSCPLRTSQSRCRQDNFFLKISTFFRPRNLHRFCRLLGSLGAPFSTSFPTFWHHFPILFGTSILYRFLDGFFIDFYMIFDDFFDGFFDLIRKTRFLWNVCFSLGKIVIFKVRHLQFFMFFRWFFDHFSTSNFVSIFHDFGCHFGSIFHPFSTLWP